MTPPLVSVIVPTYNRRQLICQTIDSVLAQTYSHLEIIVVDDGSTDGTGELLKERYSSEPRVRYIWQQNAERAAARNTGIKAARGAFVAFLDSDDLWVPHKLASQLPLFDADPSLIMVYSGCSWVDSQLRTVQNFVLPTDVGQQRYLFERLVYANTIPCATVVVRRGVFEQVGFFDEAPRLIPKEDWSMWTRIARAGPVGYVPACLSVYRMHAQNTDRPLDPAFYDDFLQSVLVRPGVRADWLLRRLIAHRFWALLHRAVAGGQIDRARGGLVRAWRHAGFAMLADVSANLSVLATIVVGERATAALQRLNHRWRSGTPSRRGRN
jgi:glycosyltransferase involved in cell wall biosynthesis